MNWNYPTNIWFGEGKIEDLAEACFDLKIKNPLFVTDKDLLNLPMTSKVIEKLKNEFENLQVFSNFSGNPTGKNVTEGVSLYLEKNCDGVIAFDVIERFKRSLSVTKRGFFIFKFKQALARSSILPSPNQILVG